MTTLSTQQLLALSSVFLSASLACTRNRQSPSPDDEIVHTTGGTSSSGEHVDEAEADLEAAPGKKIHGEAELTATATGVIVVVDVKDAPSGAKGIHIHEKGDCSDIPGKSMGGHFAPGGHDHALPDQGARHLGDLGNIEVGENGQGHLEIMVEGANLKKDDPMSFLGKSLVIHEDADKGSSDQPAGASGTPMACGVIKED